MTPKKGRHIVSAIAFVGCATILAAALIEDLPIAIAGILVLFVAIYFRSKLLRCPSCRRGLPNKGIFAPKHCPYCAESLDKSLFDENK